MDCGNLFLSIHPAASLFHRCNPRNLILAVQHFDIRQIHAASACRTVPSALAASSLPCPCPVLVLNPAVAVKLEGAVIYGRPPDRKWLCIEA